VGFPKFVEEDAPLVAPPQPTLSPREVLRVFEEFVGRDSAPRRAEPEVILLTRRTALADEKPSLNRLKRS